MASKLSIRPRTIFYTLVTFTLTCFVSSTLGAPAPDVIDDWNTNKVHQIKGNDGNIYELSTRDIILISLAAILVFFIFVCLIGYCLCECVRSIICCIFCCE